MKTLVAAMVIAGAGLIPVVGYAKPQFPPEIARHLSATVDPACSVCHLDGKIAGVTVITPFALALRAHGFTSSEDTLNSALDAMQADNTDSDGDGISDVEELRAGTDPNSPVPGATTADPTYGCSLTSRPSRGGWTAVALSVAAAVTLRRRRRKTPHRSA